MEKQYIGVTDLPRESNESDLLNTDAYASGLCRFIENCHTPMTVALQGDWGSGKTSILNYIDKYFVKSQNTIVKINTWQYAQITRDENLVVMVLTSILASIDQKYSVKNKEKIAAMLKLLARGAVKFIGGGDDTIDVFESRKNELELIVELRDDFRELISQAVRGKRGLARVIILIDDLDRLNPDRAVEFLEALKLFLDVEDCVFVLAVDYDVVVQGVQSKFGESITLEKCRSFFDKIVQLPFHMPVERYELTGMIETYLGEKLKKEHIEIVSDFAKSAIGANPRTLKRLVNAFLLLEIIQKELNPKDGRKDKKLIEDDNALLFCILCIQIRHPALYSYLSDSGMWLEQAVKTSSLIVFDDEDVTPEDSLQKRLLEMSDEKFDGRQLGLMLSILDQLDTILNQIIGKTAGSRYEHLSNIISLSSVTSRENAPQKQTRSLRGGTAVSIRTDAGETIYNSASEAFISVIETLLNNSKRIDECIAKFPGFLTTDPNDTRRAFANGKRVYELAAVTSGGAPVYTGLKSGTPEKRGYISGLRDFLGLRKGAIIWSEAQESFEL